MALLATIRSVSGGRVIVDFNNPLAGREVSYTVFVRRLVCSLDEKISVLARHFLRTDKFKVSEDSIKIKGIYGKFGSQTFEVIANIYSTIEDKNKTEQKTKKLSCKE